MAINLELANSTLVNSDSSIDITHSSNIEVCAAPDDFQVTVNRKEYSIVGDELYIPKRYEDAPQWMQDLIDTVTANGISTAMGDLSTLSEALNTLIPELEAAKNTYTQSIISSNDIDQRINTAITTLNSSLGAVDATILGIAETAVTPEEAVTIAGDVLSAALIDDTVGSLGATITDINTAIIEEETARTTSMTNLESSLQGDIEANASATTALQTYVGVDGTGAAQNTGLSAYLYDFNTGTIGGADSELNNTIKTTAEGIESKFAYNSTLNLNGIYYTSGFGLNTSLQTSGSGTENDPYSSEFWINAEKFKFSNGACTPFSVDQFGNTSFTGKVIFTSGCGSTETELTESYLTSIATNAISQVAVGDKNINITDNLIPTTSLLADENNAGYQLIGTYTKTSITDIEGFVEPEVILGVDGEMYSPYIDEPQYAYYYRFAITGVTNLDNFTIISIDTEYIDDGNDGWVVSPVEIITPVQVVIADDDGADPVVPPVMSADTWYIIDGIINPSGITNTEYNGSIRTVDGTRVGWVQNISMSATTGVVGDPGTPNDRFILGWTGSATNVEIARMKLAKITADTATGSTASIDYVNQQVADYFATLASSEEARDGLITTYYENTAPVTNVSYGDYWLDTNDINYTVRRYEDLNGQSIGTLTWVENESTTATLIKNSYIAQLAANNAQATADGKITTYYQSTVPSNASEGDLWINLNNNNLTFRYTNNVWTIVQTIPSSTSQLSNDSDYVNSTDVVNLVETVSVGDKNINITDNVIPVTSLVGDTNNSGYQFFGDPTKTVISGIDLFPEPSIILDSNDEVYSPYIDETSSAWYFRYGVTGITDLSQFAIYSLDSSYASTSINTSSVTGLENDKWYTVEGIVLPYGSTSYTAGSVRDSSGSKVAEFNSINMLADTDKVSLGWLGSCTISRMKLAKITADTTTQSNASIDYVDNNITSVTDNIYYPGTTTINGANIYTGSILASSINTVGLIAEDISTNTLIGKQLYGSYIEGAVIKASYLDLDGELEVLTDYHLWLTQTDMDTGIALGQTGQLYTNSTEMPGAIYISGTNEYRLATVSSFTLPSSSLRFLGTTTCNINGYAGKIVHTNTYIAQSDILGSYKSYDSNYTLRFRKKLPTFTTSDASCVSVGITPYSDGYSNLQKIMDYGISFGANIHMPSITAVNFTVNGGTSILSATINGQTINHYNYTSSTNPATITTYTVNGINFYLKLDSSYREATYYVSGGWSATITLGVKEGSHTLTSTSADISKGFRVWYYGDDICTLENQGLLAIYFPSITVNNMV